MEDDPDRPIKHVHRPPIPGPTKPPESNPPTDGKGVAAPFSPAIAAQSLAAKHPLFRFSLRGSADQLEADAADTKPLLGRFIMDGQATMIYAAPNTGKTLIILYLALRAIVEGKIDPHLVIYVNADDSSSGLACKGRLFQDAGAHMMAPGQKGIKIRHLVEKLVQAVEDGSARGTLVIIDTLKKFTDLMDKKRTSEFGQVCREYVMAGGTIVALGHTRKSPKADGTPQYQGTTDILEDFDAVYVAELVSDRSQTDRRIVRLNMEKKRADSPNEVAYAYADEAGMSYEEKLASVEPVDPDDLADYRRPETGVDEVRVRIAIGEIIGDGFPGGKMALAEATARACSISKRKAIRIIEGSTGSTQGVHLWETRTGEHNTQIYRMIIFD